MKEVIGSPGTKSGLMLRIGQCIFASASLGVMVAAAEFSSYTAFCYLVASMGLQVLWSFGLACLDVYALRIKRDLQNPILVSLFVVGDWISALYGQGRYSPTTFFFKVKSILSWKIYFVYAQVTATLSLAAACSSAGIVVLYSRDLNFCNVKQDNLPCDKYQISIAFAFLTWFLIGISSHVMFWILASV